MNNWSVRPFGRQTEMTEYDLTGCEPDNNFTLGESKLLKLNLSGQFSPLKHYRFKYLFFSNCSITSSFSLRLMGMR
jgi:hypothetical protein